MLIIQITARPINRHGRFAVEFAGSTICHSARLPAFDGARRLLELGHDPSALLVMWRDGVRSLQGRLGDMADLTVSEEANRPPRFKRWKPRDLGEGSPSIALNEFSGQFPGRVA